MPGRLGGYRLEVRDLGSSYLEPAVKCPGEDGPIRCLPEHSEIRVDGGSPPAVASVRRDSQDEET